MMTPIFIVPFFIVFATVDVFAAVTRKLDYPLICHLNSKHSAHHRNSKIDCSDDFFVPVHWAGAIAGALSCSLSHVLLLPIDVLKTKIQSGADATIHIRCIDCIKQDKYSKYIAYETKYYNICSGIFLLYFMVLLRH